MQTMLKVIFKRCNVNQVISWSTASRFTGTRNPCFAICYDPKPVYFKSEKSVAL